MLHQIRAAVAAVLIVSLVVEPVAFAAGDLTLIQDAAPTIYHIPLDKLKPGSSARIEATVSDDVGIKEVNLFYRTSSEGDYHRVKMVASPDSDMYWIVLPENIGTRIDYYLQATDTANNVTFKGAAFAPLTVATVKVAPAQPKAEAKSGINWLWAGLGGALLLGLAAGSGGGGGGSGGGGGNVNFSGTLP